MGQVAQRYPDDKEASILYALILSSNFDPTDRQYTNQLKLLESSSRFQRRNPIIRRGALAVPHLRLPAARFQGAGCGSPLRQAGCRCAACAAHASHLHPRRCLEGVNRIQRSLSEIRHRQDVRQMARVRLHGLCTYAARTGSGRAQNHLRRRLSPPRSTIFPSLMPTARCRRGRARARCMGRSRQA